MSDFLHAHGIAPEVAKACGVRFERGAVVFRYETATGDDFERRRLLNGGQTKVIQPAGTPLRLWWPDGPPRNALPVLVCEGEADALAALTARRSAPLPEFQELSVAAIPGTAFPPARLAADLQRLSVREAWLCFDADRAGRDSQQKATEALRELGIRAIPVHLPDNTDLADNIVCAADPGDWLANLLVDAEGAEHEALQADLDVLTPVAGFIRQFVVLGEHEAHAIALWVVHTHVIESADTTPYLSITSAEKESGKTRLLEVLELLVARPWLTGRVTAAVLVRKVDEVGPTLLLDESDAAFGSDREYAEALRGILNTGYRRGGKASVCVGQGSNISYRDLSTFCPKAIAGIGGLPDTVASRSIAIRLSRKHKDEPVTRFRQRHVVAEAQPLLERLEKFAERHEEALSYEPEAPGELGDRAADSWEPLLAIADFIGDGWPDRARAAALALSGTGETEDGSVGVQLLTDIARVFGDRSRVPTAELLEGLNGMEESRWGGWGSRRRDPGLSARDLARLLKPYGIRSRSIRLEDGSTPKGFLRQQFADSWKRYVSTLSADPAATPPHPASSAESGSADSRHNEAARSTSNESGFAGELHLGCVFTLKGTAEDDRSPRRMMVVSQSP